MQPTAAPFPLLTAADIAAMQEKTHQHKYNPKGVRITRSLSDAVGMSQIGVHLVRIRKGQDTTEYHTHTHDEEWVYILSGKGVAEIDGRRMQVEPGDFMGFVAGSVPHSMSNPYDEDLVYLLGGTRHAYDIVDYPRKGIRSYKYEGGRDDVEFRNVVTR